MKNRKTKELGSQDFIDKKQDIELRDSEIGVPVGGA